MVNWKELRKKRLHFGLVFQSFNLFPQYTALENVTLAKRLMAKEDPHFKENKKGSIIAILLELPLLVSISFCIYCGIIGIDFWGPAYGISGFLVIALAYGGEFYPITIMFVIGFIASIMMIIRMRKK